MWTIAVFIGSIVWAVLGVFLVYSTGTLFLQGNFHQFFIAALLWGLSCVAVIVFTALA